MPSTTSRKVVQTLEDAEARSRAFPRRRRGAIQVTAPLGIGKRIVAPLIPEFVDNYPEVSVRLRLSDRKVDMLEDGLDVAFFIGRPPDSDLKMRKIMDTPRVLCAAPAYLERYGTPADSRGPAAGTTACCCATQIAGVVLDTADRGGTAETGRVGPLRFRRWRRADGLGAGRARHREQAALRHVPTIWRSGALVEVLPETPPEPALFGCLYPHRRLQDSKVRLFIDFLLDHSRKRIDHADGKAVFSQTDG